MKETIGKTPINDIKNCIYAAQETWDHGTNKEKALLIAMLPICLALSASGICYLIRQFNKQPVLKQDNKRLFST